MAQSRPPLPFRAIHHFRRKRPAEFCRTAWRYANYRIARTGLVVTGDTYYALVTSWYRLRRTFDTDGFRSPVDPYGVRWVSPERIETTTGRPLPVPYDRRFREFGAVETGRWDTTDELAIGPWRPEENGDNTWFNELLMAKQFDNSTFYRSLEAHFGDDVAWENTDFYRRVTSGLEAGRPPHLYAKDRDSFRRKLDEIDVLYESVRENGVVPQRKADPKPIRNLVSDSILVDIGRDGRLLFVEGRRRLSVAKILGIDSVPVRIAIRHRDWMEHRDEVYEQGRSVGHPDFAEFG